MLRAIEWTETQDKAKLARRSTARNGSFTRLITKKQENTMKVLSLIALALFFSASSFAADQVAPASDAQPAAATTAAHAQKAEKPMKAHKAKIAKKAKKHKKAKAN